MHFIYISILQQPLIPGFREMKEDDVDAVHKLLNNYLNKFDVAPIFSIEDVKHWLVPKEEVVFSYVVEVTDKY